MLFAAGEIWVSVIQGISTVVVTLIGGIVTYYLRQMDLKLRDAAVNVAEVKTTLHEVTNDQNSKLNGIADKVEVVHRATNSIKDELVKSTAKASRAEGVAEGVQQERDRQQGPTGPGNGI